jgi:hypothetical protein
MSISTWHVFFRIGSKYMGVSVKTLAKSLKGLQEGRQDVNSTQILDKYCCCFSPSIYEIGDFFMSNWLGMVASSDYSGRSGQVGSMVEGS